DQTGQHARIASAGGKALVAGRIGGGRNFGRSAVIRGRNRAGRKTSDTQRGERDKPLRRNGHGWLLLSLNGPLPRSAKHKRPQGAKRTPLVSRRFGSDACRRDLTRVRSVRRKARRFSSDHLHKDAVRSAFGPSMGSRHAKSTETPNCSQRVE